MSEERTSELKKRLSVDTSTDQSNKSDYDEDDAPSRLARFKLFLYNPRKKSVLGRTAISWALISTYYSIFYTLLASFFIILFAVFVTTLNDRCPTFFNIESVMDYRGVNPGLGFRPLLNPASNTIFLGSSESTQEVIDSYKKYIADFLTQSDTTGGIDCIKNIIKDLSPTEVCLYSYDEVANGTICDRHNANFAETMKETPCVVVKLNRIYGWTPTKNETVNVEGEQLPANHVYFKCEGMTAYDIEHFPNLTYYSMETKEGSNEHGSLPNSYFPYTNRFDYVPPFVVVHFHSLPDNQVLNVLCKAYAQNIDHDRQNLRGMAHLQFFKKVDEAAVESKTRGRGGS